MNVTYGIKYGRGFAPVVPAEQRAQRMQMEIIRELSRVPTEQEPAQLIPYEPITEHYFHGGMYCRKVFRRANTVVVGKVHKKEHFYVIVSGTVAITTDKGEQLVTGPVVLECRPGTKRVVYAETDALCMTFHRTNATTVEEAEKELVEDDPHSMYGPGNLLKCLHERLPQLQEMEALK